MINKRAKLANQCLLISAPLDHLYDPKKIIANNFLKMGCDITGFGLAIKRASYPTRCSAFVWSSKLRPFFVLVFLMASFIVGFLSVSFFLSIFRIRGYDIPGFILTIKKS